MNEDGEPQVAATPRRRLGGRLGHLRAQRSLSVYAVLAAGIAVLIVLLLVIWYTASDGGNKVLVCQPIRPDDVEAAIQAGEVEKLTVVQGQDRPEVGPVVVSVTMTDGTCGNLPGGVTNQRDLYVILGMASYFGRVGDQRIRVQLQEQPVRPELLATATTASTPTSTATPTASAAPTPGPASPTAGSPTSVPAATATATATPTASANAGIGSPAASPVTVGSPLAPGR